MPRHGETHHILFDGIRRATVTVRDSIELLAIVSMMRAVIDGPDFALRDESELSAVTSNLVRIF